MIQVFGRGGRVPYRVPYGELHESRSPIYINVRAEVRLWGGVFRTINIFWVRWSSRGRSDRKNPSAQSSQFSRKNVLD
jgi:hypothetical protein